MRTAVDLEHGVNLTVVVDSDNTFFGRFAFAERGTGIFWASGATVTPNDDGTIDVAFVGDGSLDKGATVDVFNGLHAYSGKKVPTVIDLAVRLDSSDGSGTGRLIADGITHALSSVVADPPPASASVDAIVELLGASDWSGLHAWYTIDFREAYSADELEAQMANGLKAYGVIVVVRIVSPVIERASGFGHSAEVSLETDFTLAGEVTSWPTRMSLVYEAGHWSISTIDPFGDPIR